MPLDCETGGKCRSRRRIHHRGIAYNPRVARTGYQQLLRRYQRYAPEYDSRFARYSDGTLGRAMAHVPDGDGLLLDVACGTGLFEARLAEQRRRMRAVGVDLSPEMLTVAREHFADDDRYKFVTGSAEHLPFADDGFDVVVCNNAFHLVQEAGAALREFHRVLRPGGRVVIIDWCRDAPQMALMAVGLKLSDRQVRRIRTLAALVALVEEHGFAVTHRERFRVKPLWGLMAVVGEKR